MRETALRVRTERTPSTWSMARCQVAHARSMLPALEVHLDARQPAAPPARTGTGCRFVQCVDALLDLGLEGAAEVRDVGNGFVDANLSSDAPLMGCLLMVAERDEDSSVTCRSLP